LIPTPKSLHDIQYVYKAPLMWGFYFRIHLFSAYPVEKRGASPNVPKSDLWKRDERCAQGMNETRV